MPTSTASNVTLEVDGCYISHLVSAVEVFPAEPSRATGRASSLAPFSISFDMEPLSPQDARALERFAFAQAGLDGAIVHMPWRILGVARELSAAFEEVFGSFRKAVRRFLY